MNRGWLVIFIVGVILAFLGIYFFNLSQNSSGINQFKSKPFSNSHSEQNSLSPPENLTLPIRASDINNNMGTVNPFGPIRGSKDSGHGHGGIDFPSDLGTRLYAVADGELISLVPAEDGRAGFDLKILLVDGVREGEGWAFLYEHVTPVNDLQIGSSVKKGQLIGTSPFDAYTTNHFQLSYWFNDFKFSKNVTCWVNQLDSVSFSEITNWFDQYKKSTYFIEMWSNLREEGKYQFRDFLDIQRFPDGPQLCYPLGTDVRS